MTNKCAIKLLVLVFLAIMLSPCWAASADNMDRALDQYDKGSKAYEVRNWRLASIRFEESFRYIPNSLSAFMLSQAYCQLENRDGALKYATKALTLSPRLPEEHIAKANETIIWAKSKQTKEARSDTRLAYSTNRVETLTAKQQVFNRPRIPQGIRVDWCRFVGTDCGEGAANAFCGMYGFQRALSFEIENDIGASSPTYVIGSNKLCTGQTCDGFRFIVCEK